MVKKGKVGDSWSGYLPLVTRAYDQIMRDFESFMSEEKKMMQGRKKDKKSGADSSGWSEEKYYKDQMMQYARNIQKEYKKFKTALKKLDIEKSFYDIR